MRGSCVILIASCLVQEWASENHYTHWLADIPDFWGPFGFNLSVRRMRANCYTGRCIRAYQRAMAPTNDAKLAANLRGAEQLIEVGNRLLKTRS